MRRASRIVAWLIVLLGARMVASAPAELSRGHAPTGMALLSVGMVLVIGGGLALLGGRRPAAPRVPTARPTSTDEWASPSARGDDAGR